MKRWIAFLLAITLLLVPAPVQAQQVQINLLEIDLWPEYDRRELLVIYRISLAESTALPAKLSLRIPAAAGAPYNVALKDPADGLLYVVDYSLLEEGNWQRVNFTTSSREVQLEYYDPSITFDGSARSVSYTWPGDYAVEALSIVVQQPINAEEVRFAPSMGEGKVSEVDGLTYFGQEVGKVAGGESFLIRMTYTKPDDTLSANQAPVAASLPLDEPATRQVSPGDVLGINRNIVIWLAMIAGSALLIGAVIWLLRSGRQTSKKSRRHSGEKVYCTECGKPAHSSDTFCRTCGTRLKGR